MVLERAAAAARGALERTSGRTRPSGPADGPAAVEVLIDGSLPESVRVRAAAQLGLGAASRARAIALEDGKAVIRAVAEAADEDPTAGDLREGGRRAGIGPAVAVADLPSSWAAAQTALRLTAEGTARDPGPRVVHADDLGGLAVLASAVGPDTRPVPDVLALERAAQAAGWMLQTLDAVAASPSMRAAAAALTMHHSTLQDRFAQAERLLGWSLHDPQGRLRLQLALALRRLHRNPPGHRPG
ncbi:helix-turn-helix domain-containing protein [Frankia sp. CN6]|uniref:Helix-turn-helix domain-containing protein n=2 Tax=Frankia nepalensis TaxID=1836974 RepID=A0A937RQB7_9ACTN|nr:helix-turn-helix domain-containing protein [Frankia nepalensis]